MTGLVSCSLASCSFWLRSCNTPFSPFPQCKRRNFSTQPQKLSLFPLFLSLPVCKTGIAVKRKLSLTCVQINNLNRRHSWFYRRGTVSAWLCVKQQVENSMFLIWGRKCIVFHTQYPNHHCGAHAEDVDPEKVFHRPTASQINTVAEPINVWKKKEACGSETR